MALREGLLIGIQELRASELTAKVVADVGLDRIATAGVELSEKREVNNEVVQNTPFFAIGDLSLELVVGHDGQVCLEGHVAGEDASSLHLLKADEGDKQNCVCSRHNHSSCALCQHAGCDSDLNRKD